MKQISSKFPMDMPYLSKLLKLFLTLTLKDSKIITVDRLAY